MQSNRTRNGSKFNRKHLIFLLIYVFGFLVGTISHGLDILAGEFLGYSFAPMAFNLFWSSLIIIDPLVIVMLMIHLRLGVIFAVFVMILDIGINVFYGVTYENRSVLLGLITQIPFGIFVWITAKGILKYPSLQDYLSLDLELT